MARKWEGIFYTRITVTCGNVMLSDTRHAYGRLASRTWARGVSTAYAYDGFGRLVSMDYSDATPDAAYEYDAFGRLLSARTFLSSMGETVSSTTNIYDGLDLVTEIQNGTTITRSADTFGRASGLSLGDAYAVSYGYDESGRFSSVSSVCSVVNYTYLPGSDLISGYTADTFTRSVAYEPNRDLVSAVSNLWGTSVISAYEYANDALGRRVSRADSGLAFAQPQANTFSYNPRSEVTGAVMHTNTYGYAFDPIGNRTSTTENTKVTEYQSNELNQYMEIQSLAVSGQPLVNVTSPTFDVDGNMTFDGREWHYTWNGENRMILASNAAHTVTYAYDHMGRMIVKELSDVANNYKLETKNFIWDRWNIIAESIVSPSPILNSSFLITNSTCYVWGLDLSGSLQGAGGVGGLLAVVKDDDVFAPVYDANGNISEYVLLESRNSQLETGAIAAHYEYSPFGETTVQSGPMADDFAFRFSTKCWEAETGILHYEFRPYSPSLGIWLCHDPIGELGGLNLYGFTGNDSVNAIDVNGLWILTFKTSGFSNIWTPNQQKRFNNMFDSLKSDMPKMIERANQWLEASQNLPDKCEIKEDMLKEVKKLLEYFEEVEKSLASDKKLIIRAKNLGPEVDAQAMFTWVTEKFKGELRFNTNKESSFINQNDKILYATIFHELLHAAGAPDEKKATLWAEDAQRVENLIHNPNNFGLMSLIIELEKKHKPKCCPKDKKTWIPLP